MAVDLRSAARALRGEVSGNAISCPGPGHSKVDRSLRVYLDHQSPTGIRVHSHAGDDWRECQDHVLRLLGDSGTGTIAVAARSSGEDASWSRSRRNLALDIWSESTSIAATIGAKYLTRRIGREIDWPVDFRFNPRCPRGKDRLPALIALLRDIETDEPAAIQRIYLRPDGSDRLRDAMGKATLGPAKNAVCKLSPNDDVTLGLGIGEGVEKSLSLLAAGWAPIWSTCGTATMSTFPVLAGIEALTIFADNDAAGHRASRVCATRWVEAGHSVAIRTPKIGGDWGDALDRSAAA